MRPGRAAIMTTRFDRNTASWIEWVTKTTVSFLTRHSSSSSASSRLARDLVERAERLVHQQQLRAATTSARAIDTRICMPPERVRGSAFAKLLRPTSASASATRRVGLGARHAGEVERQAHVGLRRWPRASASAPGRRRPCACGRSPRAARTGLAPQQQAAVGRLEQAGHHLQQRALAAARGAEQRHELALGDGEVDRLQRVRAVRDRSSRADSTSTAGIAEPARPAPVRRRPLRITAGPSTSLTNSVV